MEPGLFSHLAPNGSADAELSALTNLRLDFQAPAVFIRPNLMGDRQPQSSTFTRIFCREKVVKDVALNCGHRIYNV